MRCRVLAALAFLLSLPSLGFGQSTITGTIRDASGAVLPGVTVEAASPALIEKVRSSQTDGTGQYRIENLRSGVYTVTFTLPGFATVVREGVELAGTFTATINADLRVGALEETVTVTGESPTVDVQNTTRQMVINSEVADALPTWRQHRNLALLNPAVMGSSPGPDVGGLAELSATTLKVHGSTQNDQRHMMMGLSLGGGSQGGASSRTLTNMSALQEVTVGVGAVDAEVATGGVRFNLIPKDGGNRFSGVMFWGYGTEALQGNNMTPELEEVLGTPDALRKVWDVNPGMGGPILRDKVWFYTAYKHEGVQQYPAGIFTNLNANNPNAWTYEPDLTSRPFNDEVQWQWHGRITWQATSKLKTGWTVTKGYGCRCSTSIESNIAPEAASHNIGKQDLNLISDWTMPITNRFLIDGGLVVRTQDTISGAAPPGTNPAMISVTEQSLGNFVYRMPNTGTGVRPTLTYGPFNDIRYFRFAASYVTGGHAFRAGFNLRSMSETTIFGNLPAGAPQMMYRFNRGVPNQVTLFAYPVEFNFDVPADHGVFVQDRWTFGRMTASYGLRYDYFANEFPAVEVGPTALLPNRNFSFPKTSGISWHDIAPKSGLSYDVFGNSKTALKVSLNKYITGMGNNDLFFGSTLNPVQRLSNVTTRAWNDADGDFVPDCDLANFAGNGECGAMANQNFGRSVGGNAYDPDVLRGWGRRPYNWEFSAGVQQEVLPRVSIDVTYYRRWFGNFFVIDNRAVGPEDFTAFSIVAPNTDSRLPTAGQTLTGYYDLNPNKVGQVDNYITKASNYGDQRSIWSGVDVSLSARPRNGLLVQGGTSTGRQSNDTCDIRASLPEYTLMTPGQITMAGPLDPFCDATGPFLTNVKFLASYTIPRIDVQVSSTLQNVPGALADASFVASNALVAPSLGRPLSGGASNVTIPLIERSSLFTERINSMDVRFGKVLTLGALRTALNVDVFNVLNAHGTVTALTTFGGALPWLSPRTIIQARMLKLSAQLDF